MYERRSIRKTHFSVCLDTDRAGYQFLNFLGLERKTTIPVKKIKKHFRLSSLELMANAVGNFITANIIEVKKMFTT